MKTKELWTRFKSFILECKRVLQVTRKPNKAEYITVVKVTGLGILIIGLLGFLVNLIWQMGIR